MRLYIYRCVYVCIECAYIYVCVCVCIKPEFAHTYTVTAIIIGEWKCGGARTIYFQWRKAGGELFRVAVTKKKSSFLLFFFCTLFFCRSRGWQPQVAETRGRPGRLQRRVLEGSNHRQSAFGRAVITGTAHLGGQ